MRGVGWLGASARPGDDALRPEPRASATWRTCVAAAGRGRHRSGWPRSPTSALGPGFRRGVLEKDGNEVTGGVVLMAHGENPLEVTRRLKAKIRELQAGLPAGRRDRPVLRPHAADPGGDRHRHRHGRRGDDLGHPLRAR